MDFKFNDRKGSKQLSDQIIDSAEEVFNILLSDDFVQQFLMFGEMSGPNKVIGQRRIKDTVDNEQPFKQIFIEIERLTHIEEEKQFFKTVLKGIDGQMVDHLKQMEQLFGKPDPKLMNGPITTPIYGYNNMMRYTGAKGPFLSGVVLVLAIYQLYYRLNAYLKQNPNYKPNNLTKIICYELFDWKVVCDQLRAMIDRRRDQVSETEVKELSEVIKRAILYTRAVMKHEYSGAKWFDE